MAFISRLGVVLGLDTAEFNAGLGKAEGALTKFSNTAKVAGAAAIAALGYELISTAKEAVNFADKMADVAKANEVSISTILKFSEALALNGGEASNAGKAFAAFSNAVDSATKKGSEAQKAFEKVGVTFEDIKTLTPEELFVKSVKGFNQIGDSLTRNATAAQLFGKAVKGADVKGLADEFANSTADFSKAEKAFMDINKAMDRLDLLSQRAKVSIAENMAPAINSSIDFIDELVRGLNAAGAAYDVILKKQKEARGEQGTWRPAPRIDQPMSEAVEYYKSKGIFGKTDLRQTTDPEAEKAAEALQKKIESQTQALMQNVRQLKLQTSEITTAKSMAEKLKLEFETGGKYQDIKNSKLKQELLDQAALYDAEVKKKEIAQINYDLDVKRTQQLAAELEMAQQLAASENIRVQQHQDQQRFRKEDLEAAIKREELEKSMAGQADIVVDRALKLYDLQQKINQEKRQNGLLSETEIEQWRTLEQRFIDAQEANKRAQNTFQAGWDRAWNNFMITAQDSANMGSQAFGSMVGGMERALDRFVQTGKLSFKELIGSMIQDLIKLQLRAQVSGFFSMIGDVIGSAFSSGGVSSGAGAYSIDQNPYLNWSGPRAASGGFIDGMTLVGERGPELFVPQTSGTVIPNNQLSSMMGGGEKIVYNAPVVQNMSAIDTQSALQFLSKYKDGVWAANQSANRSMPMQRA